MPGPSGSDESSQAQEAMIRALEGRGQALATAYTLDQADLALSVFDGPARMLTGVSRQGRGRNSSVKAWHSWRDPE